ncbi:MAG: hypothetical protein A2137_05010 [Chloroflexi bacterium RBG_16_58_8]|nr:MAG: hypothetical protein A2137_05010 [Chloroflexi bacterium RBG_16_58_8]
MRINKLIINTDGAARGNPGPAAIGVTLKDDAGNTVSRISRAIGVTTNNQAEYQAVIAGLARAVTLGARNVILRSDSELVVQQITGRYKVKNTVLRGLYVKVFKIASSLDSFSISYVPREHNYEADYLANQALDRP